MTEEELYELALFLAKRATEPSDTAETILREFVKALGDVRQAYAEFKEYRQP